MSIQTPPLCLPEAKQRLHRLKGSKGGCSLYLLLLLLPPLWSPLPREDLLLSDASRRPQVLVPSSCAGSDAELNSLKGEKAWVCRPEWGWRPGVGRGQRSLGAARWSREPRPLQCFWAFSGVVSSAIHVLNMLHEGRCVIWTLLFLWGFNHGKSHLTPGSVTKDTYQEVLTK